MKNPIARLKSEAAKLGCTVEFLKDNRPHPVTGPVHEITMDAPNYHVFSASFTHSLVSAGAPNEFLTMAQLAEDMLDLLSYGIERCDGSECDMCDEQKEVDSSTLVRYGLEVKGRD